MAPVVTTLAAIARCTVCKQEIGIMELSEQIELRVSSGAKEEWFLD